VVAKQLKYVIANIQPGKKAVGATCLKWKKGQWSVLTNCMYVCIQGYSAKKIATPTYSCLQLG
jgi:hypothetical protein